MKSNETRTTSLRKHSEIPRAAPKTKIKTRLKTHKQNSKTQHRRLKRQDTGHETTQISSAYPTSRKLRINHRSETQPKNKTKQKKNDFSASPNPTQTAVNPFQTNKSHPKPSKPIPSQQNSSKIKSIQKRKTHPKNKPIPTKSAQNRTNLKTILSNQNHPNT